MGLDLDYIVYTATFEKGFKQPAYLRAANAGDIQPLLIFARA